jgi:hypothetical protein
VFAFFFDEDHPDNEMFFGPQFASRIIAPIEMMRPIPHTRLLTGSLLHNMLVYEVESISLGDTEDASEPHLGRQTRAQHSMPNYERRATVVCDLAETLTSNQSSFTEHELLRHLAQKNIWVVLTPNISGAQACEIHKSIGAFGPYLGYASIELGNPLHRRLFLESPFRDKAIGPDGLAFRRDELGDDDADDHPFSSEYGSAKKTRFLDAVDFDVLFPDVVRPVTNSARGDLTAQRLSGNDPGHRAKVVRELMALESENITSPISFSARRPDDGVEFVFPPAKFTKYLFDVNHPGGGPKARFFIDTLGIQPDDWRFLADQILQGAKRGELYRLKLSPYGASHGVLVLVTGRNEKTAVIETGWRLPALGPALFVTAYPADEKLSKGLTANVGRVPPLAVVGSQRWQAIHELAHAAGMSAGEQAVPTPMVLEEYGTEWEGDCGFGWVQLPDGRDSFTRWVVAEEHGRPSYPGVRIYSKVATQSVVRHRSYANAYAEVLRSNGIDCTTGSRLD